MKNKIIALTASLAMLGGAFAALPAAAADTVDLIVNGTMEEYENEWGQESRPLIKNWSNSGSSFNRKYYDGTAENAAIGNNNTGMLLCTDRYNRDSGPEYILETNGKSLKEGAEYTISADVYAAEDAKSIVVTVAADIKCDNEGADGHTCQWGHADEVYKTETLNVIGGTWQTIKATFTPTNIYSESNLPESEENLSFGGTYLRITTTGSEYGYKGEFYVDNVKFTYEDSTPAAQIGEKTYASLDEAIKEAAENGTVTVLKDTTLSSAVTKSVTLKGAEGAAKLTVTVTAVPDAAAVLFGGASTTLENIVISGGDTPNNAPETTQETRYKSLINWGRSLTVKDAEIKNLSFADRSGGVFTFDNVRFSGIYRDGWFLTTTGDSTLKNVTAADNNFVHEWVGFICTEKGNVTFENCTIKDNNNCRAVWTGDADGSLAVLNGGNDLASVCIGRGGALKINEAAPMSKMEIDDKTKYSLTLGADFSGELTIPLNAATAAAGKAVAKVEDGADVSGVTVTGMDTEALELKTADGELVIAEKAAEFSAAASLDEIKKGTGEFSDTVAAGFKAEVTNTGSARGTFDTTIWNVTSSGETRTTGEKDITAVTLEAGGKAEIYLIVSGLDDKAATATVEVK